MQTGQLPIPKSTMNRPARIPRGDDKLARETIDLHPGPKDAERLQ